MDQSPTKPRILFLYPGFVPPPLKKQWDKHFYLSEIASGDILLPVWWSSQEEAKEKLGIKNNQYPVNNFSYHLFYAKNYPSGLKAIFIFLFYFFQGLRIYRKRPFDYIVSYGTNLTGIAACFLKILTRAKLIIDLPGVPAKAFLFDRPKVSFSDKIKKLIADTSFKFCLKFADVFKLMSTKQLVGYALPARIKQFCFHEFVPISTIDQSKQDEKYILFLGHPWYLKGVDILILAFREIYQKHPQYRLKVVGHCEDMSYFEDLTIGCPGIEFLPGVTYDKAQDLIAKCSVFALPSRTEAMGRVLLEAMACGKPIVASATDGIVDYIVEGENGVFFQAGDYRDLANKLSLVLQDSSIREELSLHARKTVFDIYSEKVYVDSFRQMILPFSR